MIYYLELFNSDILHQIGAFFTKHKSHIEIIAGIGTFISALVSLITLIEIKKQRRSVYIPDIVINSFTGYLHYDYTDFLTENNLFFYKTSTYNEDVEASNKQNIKKRINIHFSPQNAGFGVAKYLEGKWNYDFERALNELKKILPPDYTIELNESVNNYPFHIISHVVFSNFYKSFSSSDIKSSVNIDFVLPNSIRENKSINAIPHAIIELMSLYITLKYELSIGGNRDIIVEEFKDFPTLSLNLTYKDIAKKKYSKSFEFSFSFINTNTHPQAEKDEIGYYHIDVKEK